LGDHLKRGVFPPIVPRPPAVGKGLAVAGRPLDHASSPIRVVFYRDDGKRVAHCLEFNLMGDGGTKRAAIVALGDAIASQVGVSLAHDNPGNLFKPAEGNLFGLLG
jgi:hypothetical protein